MTPKPIDLIVANTMHECAVVLRQHQLTCKDCSIDREREWVARHLLGKVAREAKLSSVLDALKAVGAPHSLDSIGEGLQAIADLQVVS